MTSEIARTQRSDPGAAVRGSVRTRRGRVIGRPSFPLLAWCWTCIPCIFIFCWAVLAKPPNDPGNIVPISLVYGGLVVVLYLIGTTRVVVHPQHVDMVSFVVTYRVPFEAISCSLVRNGFELELVSGRRVGTMALGDSLIGQVLGQRRARRVARRLHALTGIEQERPVRSWRQEHVAASPRYRAFAVAAAFLIALVTGSLFIHFVT